MLLPLQRLARLLQPVIRQIIGFLPPVVPPVGVGLQGPGLFGAPGNVPPLRSSVGMPIVDTPVGVGVLMDPATFYARNFETYGLPFYLLSMLSCCPRVMVV